MATSRRNYGKSGRKSRKLNRTSKAANKRIIQRALRAKGKGSVTRVWGMSRSAGFRGQPKLATSLGRIAMGKAAYARRKKR